MSHWFGYIPEVDLYIIYPLSTGADMPTPRGMRPLVITTNQSNAITAELHGQKFNILDARLASILGAELH